MNKKINIRAITTRLAILKNRRVLQRLIGAVLAISYGLAEYSIIRTGLVPTKYLLISGFITVIAVALLELVLVWRKMSLRRGIVYMVLAGLFIIINVGISFLGFTTSNFLDRIQVGRGTSQSALPELDETKPFSIYISGIDTYGGIDTVSRSDVNILAVVNPKLHKILLVNTPRDYYVQLHGTTGLRDKLTHSGLYGIDMSVKTMEDLYATPIDYYLRINFTSLVNIIDVLGGVDVDSAYNFKVGSDNFVIGSNHLDGKKALEFTRDRYSFEEGDRTRGENQQRVIEAIISKMSGSSLLLHYPDILGSLQNSFQTNMSSSDMARLIRYQLDSMAKWQVRSTSVNGSDSHNYTYSMPTTMLYVMEPDMTSVVAARTEIQQYKSQ
ncbi:MAG TPA: LCP family protein [Candidatus Chromulinivoraceae bacterium]|nr:LCP family protein [Candidatus Chromulinivoraceae bacterium]